VSAVAAIKCPHFAQMRFLSNRLPRSHGTSAAKAEPKLVAETLADAHSYGFRAGRSTTDAIDQCFKVLGNQHAPAWVLEADIQGCRARAGAPRLHAQEARLPGQKRFSQRTRRDFRAFLREDLRLLACIFSSLRSVPLHSPPHSLNFLPCSVHKIIHFFSKSK
jgi:hypothetical protein